MSSLNCHLPFNFGDFVVIYLLIFNFFVFLYIFFLENFFHIFNFFGLLFFLSSREFINTCCYSHESAYF